MKLISILLLALLTISFTSATYPCGNGSCATGQICRTVNNSPGCTQANGYTEVTLTPKVIGSWYDSQRGKYYTQYEQTITNNSNRDLHSIKIGTANLRLRSYDSSSIWNIVIDSNGILSLPSYQQSINAHQTYVFGYIIEGQYQPATLTILAVTF